MFKDITHLFDSNVDLWTILGKFLLPIGIFIYWLIFLIYYPKFYSMQDEYLYLTKAYHYANIVTPNDGWIEKYPPGQSIMLALLIRLNDNYVYLLNPILFTLLTLLFLGYLRKNQLPDYFALLLLYNPTFFLFSRTIMSDISAALFFFFGLKLFMDKKKIFIGAFSMGFAISIRLAYLPLVIISIVYFLCKDRPDNFIKFKIFSGLSAGLIPLIDYLHTIINNSTFGYSSDFMDISNNFAFFFPNFTAYFLSLNLIYPLLLIIGFWYHFEGDRLLKVISLLPFFYMPFMPQPAHHANTYFVLLVLLQRYFFVSIFCLMIGYILFIHQHFIIGVKRFLPIFLALIILCTLISIFHQKYLEDKIYFNRKIYEITSENSLVILDDRIVKYLSVQNEERTYLNIEKYHEAEVIFPKIETYKDGEIFLIYDIDQEESKSTVLIEKIIKKYSFHQVLKYRKYNILLKYS